MLEIHMVRCMCLCEFVGDQLCWMFGDSGIDNKTGHKTRSGRTEDDDILLRSGKDV